ncbi:DEAD/DEAH box helicase, partial [Streptomonospora algeriensis]
MTDRLDPSDVSSLISRTYRRYLRSLLPVRDPRIAEALAGRIADSPLLSKGPLLEITPPYRTGATPRRLIGEGVLSSAFAAADGPSIHLDRPLYLHQEQAVRKARAGRNLVVATGTGSGKTESFLVPILNELEEQRARGELGPGVRAMLLYPMNALANDQVKRLRGLLAHSPHITFGRYTGETKEREHDALEAFAGLNPGEEPLPNELLSRERMRREPPHLLLTNYAMLEYMLLRPADLDLFEGQHSGTWRFIALDEAHVYDGAKAAELAMLLRRLRDRVAPSQELQCIATSATVGDDAAAVTGFASRLFNAEFTWDETDTDRQDLVQATRRTTAEQKPWGPLGAADCSAIAAAEEPGPAILEAAARHGREFPDAFAALDCEERMQRLRGLLIEGGPQPLERLADRLFADTAPEWADGFRVPEPTGSLPDTAALAALVELGSRIRDADGTPLLSARYHLFTRATDGAFTCLSEQGPHVSLARHEVCSECPAPAFEIGACKRCGDVYLIGTMEPEDAVLRLRPQRTPKDPVQWLHLGTAPMAVDDDDDTLEGAGEQKTETRHLCTGCGTVSASESKPCPASCTGRSLLAVRLLKNGSGTTEACLNCGARGCDTLRRFESGNEASAAVVATALYQALPQDTADTAADRPGGGRKLLMFSDSRQAAAFFAPYLNTSYGLLQQRRLILDGLEQGYAAGDEFWVDDLLDHTARAAAAAGHFERRLSRQQRTRRVAPWVMSELVAVDDRQSLEGRGLLRVVLDRPERAALPRAFTSQLGLSEDEVWDLFGELVRTLRQQGAVTMPEDVEADDEAFRPRLGPIFVRENGADRNRKVISWMPTSGGNRRLNYLTRLLKAIGTDAAPAMVLGKIWQLLRDSRDGWLHERRERGIGTVYQVDHTYLSLSPGSAADPPYECDTCRRLHPVAVRGVCPTINCPGTLRPYTLPGPAADDDHYRQLYRTLNPVALTAQEHTAQWSGEEAARIQQDFIHGRINALSCSTTFELGVDVGELQSVFMRNMPPTTANYVQRAGRAGRRADSAALVVTHAQRRSHDLFRYQEPEKMISGQVRAPYVPLGNERIDRRHAHSVALAVFFRHWYEATGEDWRHVGTFFRAEEDSGAPAPVTRVARFLDPVPAEVTAALRRILPAGVAAEIGVEDGAWARRLCAMLEELRTEITEDVEDFERRRLEAFETRRDDIADRFRKTIATVTRRPLLGFLATRNVLPKYGFPVDTVELRTQHSGEPVGAKLELARDLTSAIYEYAPGSSVIAGGKQWTSAGVYRLPGRALLTSNYRVCQSCGYYEESRDRLDVACPACAATAQAAPKKYCVPQFGFVASATVEPAGTVPPRRSWHGSTHVLELAKDPVDLTWPLPSGGA